jgi:hypothetical protein
MAKRVPYQSPSQSITQWRRSSSGSTRAEQHIQRSVSEPVGTPTPSQVIVNLFRRDKKTQSQYVDESPPPPPPKDLSERPSYDHDRPAIPPKNTSQMRTVDSQILSDFTVVTPHDIYPVPDYDSRKQASPPNRQSVPLRFTRSTETPAILDPAEKAQRRIEREREREYEEQQALLEEAERQARLKQERQEMLMREEEEVERRKNLYLQLTAERSQRAREIREADEQKSLELAQKRREEKAKRIEETRRIEERRREQTRMAEELAKKKELARRRAEEEKRVHISRIVAKTKATAITESSTTGWVTVQTNDSLVWKRRFYKFTGTTMFLYRSPKVSKLCFFSHDQRSGTPIRRTWTCY